MFFSLEAGFRAIDVHTLTEASLNLGASWRITLVRVILPNIRVACLSAAFLTLAIVMGEFTIASLSPFNTFPTYIQYINETKGYPASALTLLSFGITWLAMLSILLIGRKRATSGRFARGGGALMPHVELQQLRKLVRRLRGAEGHRPLAGHGASSSRCSGRAGCGKTTALRLVAGFDRPTSGPGRGRRQGRLQRARPTGATWAWSSRPTACSRT